MPSKYAGCNLCDRFAVAGPDYSLIQDPRILLVGEAVQMGILYRQRALDRPGRRELKELRSGDCVGRRGQRACQHGIVDLTDNYSGSQEGKL
jgi:hypothetical protein